MLRIAGSYIEEVGLQALGLKPSLRAGVYSNSYDASLNVKNGFPVFSTVIEANSIGKQEDQFAAFRLTDEDRQEIHRLTRDPRIGEPITLTGLNMVGCILKQSACMKALRKQTCPLQDTNAH